MQTYDTRNLTDPVRETADKIARWLYKKANTADAYFNATGLNRVFFHTVRLEDVAPVAHVVTTHELTHPYRESNSIILKMPRGRGLVLGVWGEKTRSESEGILSAITAYDEVQDAKDLDQFDTEGTLRERVRFSENDEHGSGAFERAKLRTQHSSDVQSRPERRAVPFVGPGADERPYTVIDPGEFL